MSSHNSSSPEMKSPEEIAGNTPWLLGTQGNLLSEGRLHPEFPLGVALFAKTRGIIFCLSIGHGKSRGRCINGKVGRQRTPLHGGRHCMFGNKKAADLRW